MSCFVFVNNEQVELLDDRRLALYPRFPEGTILVDPSYYPPRQVPLSTLPDEVGITARKLLPHAHYHAFAVDATTGERTPVNITPKYVIVQNLPPTATAEFVGKFFETFDYVVEGDTVKHGNPSQPQCKGRGFVQFSNPETARNVLAGYKSIAMYGSVPVWLDGSDHKPKGCSLPPPQYNQAGGTAANANSNPFIENRGPSRHSVPAAPIAIATSTCNYYFVTNIYEEHIQTSVRDGIFWPTKINQRAFYGALERGPVFLIFNIVQRPAAFGYARLTPRDMARNKHANFTLEWVKHNLYLSDDDFKAMSPAVQMQSFADGTAIRPETGQAICDFMDKFQERAMPASLLPHPQGGNVNTNNGPSQSQQPQQSRGGPPISGHHHHHHHQHHHHHHHTQSPTSQSGPSMVPPAPRSAMSNATSGSGDRLSSPTSIGQPNFAPPPAQPPMHHMQHYQHHHHHHHHHRSFMPPGSQGRFPQMAPGGPPPPPPPGVPSMPMRGGYGPR